MKRRLFAVAPALLICVMTASGCEQTNVVRGPLVASGPVPERVLDDINLNDAGLCNAASVFARRNGCDF